MPETRAHIYFAGLLLAGAVIYFFPISALGALVFKNHTYSHITLVPFVSLFLLASQRRSILAAAGRRPATGFAVCVGGLAVFGIASALRTHLGSTAVLDPDVPNDYLTLGMIGAVAWVIGSFIAVYGTHAFKRARFALLFLMFAIPIPMFLLSGIITSLQYASAEVSDVFFTLTGAPYHRSGFVFEFPNVSVQVAEQCSGIRSSLSLFALSIVTGFLFLRTLSRRIILTLAIFPITVIKNALRIVTVTLLANYVDTHFLSNHWIHQSGGIPFFAVALTMFIPLVWLLRKSEGRSKTGGSVLKTSWQRAVSSEPAQPIGPPIESIEWIESAQLGVSGGCASALHGLKGLKRLKRQRRRNLSTKVSSSPHSTDSMDSTDSITQQTQPCFNCFI